MPESALGTIQLPINTERLRLRSLTTDDAEAVFAILGHEPTIREVSFGQPTLEAAEQWLHRRMVNQQSAGFSMWGAEEHNEDHLVGLCGFFPTDDPQVAELGYIIHADFWGQGWATETASAAVNAMTASGRHVVATIRPDNLASQRVAVKAGLTEVGEKTDPRGSLTIWRTPQSQ